MLLRTILFFVALIAAAVGVDRLARQPGELVLNWYGWQIETTAAVFVVALGLVVLLVFLATKTYVWLDLLPKRLSERLRHQRQEKGLTALSDSMSALSVGDHSKALKAAKNAKKALPHLPLADAMLAQASASAESGSNAVTYYNKLLDNSHTNLAGLKGLLQISIRENESERALTYAEELHQKTPKNLWVLEVLTELYARQSRYEEAARAAITWQKQLSKKDPALKKARFLEACNTLEAVKENIRLASPGREAEMRNKGLQQLHDLLRQTPDFAPAALFVAELESKKSESTGKAALKNARKVLRQTYQKAPAHQLADQWLKLMKDEKDDTLVKQAGRFIGPWDDHVLGLTVKARAQIKARQWSEAHKTLSRALLKGEDRTLFETFAQLEQNQHPNGGGAVRWLERALSAPDRQQGRDGHLENYKNWRKSLVRSMAGGKPPQPDAPYVFDHTPQLQDMSNRRA